MGDELILRDDVVVHLTSSVVRVLGEVLVTSMVVLPLGVVPLDVMRLMGVRVLIVVNTGLLVEVVVVRVRHRVIKVKEIVPVVLLEVVRRSLMVRGDVDSVLFSVGSLGLTIVVDMLRSRVMVVARVVEVGISVLLVVAHRQGLLGSGRCLRLISLLLRFLLRGLSSWVLELRLVDCVLLLLHLGVQLWLH